MSKMTTVGDIMRVSVLTCCALLTAGSVAAETQAPSVQDLMVLPIRWCVLEGSSEAANVPAGGFVPTYRSDSEALLRSNDIWLDAGIFFFSHVMTDPRGNKGVPVIADPFVGEGENIGDINAAGGDPFHAAQAAAACNQVWSERAAEKEGLVLVTARSFAGHAPPKGVASKPSFTLWIDGAHPLGGDRGDDMCGHPRKLSSNDVHNFDPSNGAGQGWAIIAEPEFYGDSEPRARFLAHELGHVLFLGHGNGVDDNGDGELALFPHRRRFDQYCDPLGSGPNGSPLEDQAGNGASLMGTSAPNVILTELQIEMARATAAMMPGCLGSPCGGPDEPVVARQ